MGWDETGGKLEWNGMGSMGQDGLGRDGMGRCNELVRRDKL